MPGLACPPKPWRRRDPGIDHVAKILAKKMDRRVKPGDDDLF
jgi:hypothetical protein